MYKLFLDFFEHIFDNVSDLCNFTSGLCTIFKCVVATLKQQLPIYDIVCLSHDDPIPKS